MSCNFSSSFNSNENPVLCCDLPQFKFTHAFAENGYSRKCCLQKCEGSFQVWESNAGFERYFIIVEAYLSKTYQCIAFKCSANVLNTAVATTK